MKPCGLVVRGGPPARRTASAGAPPAPSLSSPPLRTPYQIKRQRPASNHLKSNVKQTISNQTSNRITRTTSSQITHTTSCRLHTPHQIQARQIKSGPPARVKASAAAPPQPFLSSPPLRPRSNHVKSNVRSNHNKSNCKSNYTHHTTSISHTTSNQITHTTSDQIANTTSD